MLGSPPPRPLSPPPSPCPCPPRPLLLLLPWLPLPAGPPTWTRLSFAIRPLLSVPPSTTPRAMHTAILAALPAPFHTTVTISPQTIPQSPSRLDRSRMRSSPLPQLARIAPAIPCGSPRPIRTLSAPSALLRPREVSTMTVLLLSTVRSCLTPALPLLLISYLRHRPSIPLTCLVALAAPRMIGSDQPMTSPAPTLSTRGPDRLHLPRHPRACPS
ncbi:hypothetical protein C8Q78DRAFT_479761 [Trametes maxima]|nr:hypothetical protein C8Q78DRAFT_479761 [Trametes maxima]